MALMELLYGLGLLGQGGSLLRGFQAGRTARRGTKPGALPGTIGEGTGYEPGQFGISSLDTGPYAETNAQLASEAGRLDPRVQGVLGYGYSREQNVLPQIQNSGLTGIADRLRGEQDRLSTRRQQSTDAREASRAALGTSAGDIQGRARALNEDVQGRLRRTADDPTIVSQDEINAIAGNIIANSSADFAARRAQYEGDAARRGVSSDAVRAGSVLLGEQERASKEQGIRDAIIANAVAGRARQDRATEALGTIGGSLTGLEGDLAGRFTAADIALLDAIDRGELAYSGMGGELAGQEAQLRDRQAGMLTDFYNQQSLIPLALGDIAAERGDYNTLLEAGAYDAASNRLAGLSGGLLQLGQGIQGQRQLADQQSGGLFGISDALTLPLLPALYGSAYSGLFGA